jgi:hypothetical protein
MANSLRFAVSSCATAGALSCIIPLAYAKEPSTVRPRVWMTGNRYSVPNGSLIDLDRPTPIKWFTEASESGWSKITTGPYFGAAVSTDGRLFFWNYNKESENFVSPRMVASNIQDVCATEDHIVALLKSGQIKVISSAGSIVETIKVPDRSWYNTLGFRSKFVSLQAGHRHIALVDSQGSLWTAGDNESGQCGRELRKEEKKDRFSFHKDESRTDKVEFSNTLSCVFLGNDKVSSVACGKSHTVFVTESGKAYSFGDDSKIQLGLGDTRSQDVPDYVPHSGMGRLDADGMAPDMSKLFQQTMPAVKYTFYDRHIRPKITEMKIPPAYAKPRSVVAGDDYTIVSVGESGMMIACGENQHGQCGRGFNKQQQTFSPVKLPKSTKPTAISCGSGHCVASLEDGSIYTWGLNTSGQLGIGNRAPQCPPVVMHRSKIRGFLNSDIITTIGHDATQEEMEVFLAERKRDSVKVEKILEGTSRSIPEIPLVDKDAPLSRIKKELIEAVDRSRASLMMTETDQARWEPTSVHASYHNSIIVMKC